MSVFLSILSAIASITPLLIEFMKILEKAYPEPNQGATKKQIAMDWIANVIGDEAIWNTSKSLFSALINALAKLHLGSSGKDPEPKAAQ